MNKETGVSGWKIWKLFQRKPSFIEELAAANTDRTKGVARNNYPRRGLGVIGHVRFAEASHAERVQVFGK